MRKKLQVRLAILIKLQLLIQAVVERIAAPESCRDYATDLMATMQETLKASSGIDLKELLERFAGKRSFPNSIELKQEQKVEAKEETEEKEKVEA